MTAESLEGVRASSIVSCCRQAWYQAVEQEKEDVHPNVRRLWRVRTLQNDAIVAEKAEQLRTLGAEITLEMEVPWGPGGGWTGHADLVDHTERVVFEVTGSEDLTPERRKILQCALYARNISRIRGRKYSAIVMVFSPASGEERFVPVNWEALTWELDDLEATLIAAIEANEAPERACATPGDGRARFCAFAGHCFSGWEYAPIGTIEDEALVSDVINTYALSKRADVKLIEADLKPLKERVGNALEPGAKYRVVLPDGEGEIEVKRIDVAGGESISVKEVRDAGFDFPDELVPFIKERAGHTRVSTKLIEGAR